MSTQDRAAVQGTIQALTRPIIIVSAHLGTEKGKPTEMWGRKATGLRGLPMTAGLPKPADHQRSVDDFRSVLNFTSRVADSQPRDTRSVFRSRAKKTVDQIFASLQRRFPRVKKKCKRLLSDYC